MTMKALRFDESHDIQEDESCGRLYAAGEAVNINNQIKGGQGACIEL